MGASPASHRPAAQFSDQGAGRRPGPLRAPPTGADHAVPLRCSSTPPPSSSRLQAAAGAGVPQSVRDEFDAFLECGILAHGFLRLRCDDCGHDKLVANSRKRRGFCPSCGDAVRRHRRIQLARGRALWCE